MQFTNKNILMVNDHNIGTGIGIYFDNLYQQFKNFDDIDCKMLLQNQKPKLVKKIPHDFVQFRPFNIHGTNVGLIFTLLSYYYYPYKKVPDFDIIHFSNQMMGRSAKMIHPSVITVHDIQPYLFRNNHTKIAEYYRRKHIEALVQADFIIFISKSTKNDFRQIFDIKENKTAVIYHGVSNQFKSRNKEKCRQELGLPLDRSIILHVGTEAKRKNPSTLFKTLVELKKKIPNILLIRIGKKYRYLQAEFDAMDSNDNVKYMKGLPIEKLAKFYNAVDLLIFPSIYEGFGFPVLEALKSGCPVVASNVTSIPEIVQDAGIMHDPIDVKSFTESVISILTDSSLSKQLSKKGIAQAQNFTWERAAQQTEKVYEKVLQNYRKD